MQEKLENEITKTSNFKLAHMFEIPRLSNCVTYLLFHIFNFENKNAILKKERILYLSSIERKV